MGGHLFVSMGFNFIRLITAMDQHRHVASLIAYGIAEYQLLSLCLSLPVIKKKFFYHSSPSPSYKYIHRYIHNIQQEIIN